MVPEKRCAKCGGPGPFNKRKAGADGFNKQCRKCTKEHCDAWRKAHPEATRQHTQRSNKRKLAKNPEKYRQLHQTYSREWELAHPERGLHRAAKHRAKQRGIPFDIEYSDIIIPATCPLLGVPLIRGVLKLGPNSPTLDRKIPSLGYVKGNVWVISHRANVIKNDATLEELELLTSNLRHSQE